MPAPDAARRHYLQQQALVAVVVNEMRTAWARLNLADLDASFRRHGTDMFVTLAAGQTIAAAQADPYLHRVLTEQRIDPTASAAIDANAFAGIASDGRDLETLLYEPVITTKVALADHRGADAAFAAGEAALVRITATQIQDAGRTAVATGIAARTAVTSYTRQLEPPSCSRCVALAGRIYHWNAGFARHPHCDCVHVPTTAAVAGRLKTNPDAYFAKLSPADQDKYFTKAGAESIRQGADLSQVVNARLGMYQANGETFTNVGTTKRGLAGQRLGGEARMMPETILAHAGDDRDLALELLHRHGYLI